MAVQFGKAFVSLYLDDKKFMASLRGVSTQLGSVSEDLKQASGAALRFGLVASTALGLAVREGAMFEDALLRAKASMAGITDSQFKTLTEDVRELGKESEFTAIQIANMVKMLGKGGFDQKEISGVMEAFTGGALASVMEPMEFADLMQGTLIALGMGIGDTTRVLDKMVTATNNSKLTLTEFAESMAYSGATARLAGIGLDELLEVFSGMAGGMIKGSRAGTMFNRMVKELNSGARKKIGDLLGIDSARMKITDLARAFKKYVDESGQDALKAVGAVFKDVRGARAFSALMFRTQEQTDKLTDALDRSRGALKKFADEIRSGALSKMKVALSALVDVALEVFNTFKDDFKAALDVIAKGLSIFSDWVKENKEWIKWTAIGIIAFTVLSAIILTVTIAFTALIKGSVIFFALVGGLGGFFGVLAKTVTLAVTGIAKLLVIGAKLGLITFVIFGIANAVSMLLKKNKMVENSIMDIVGAWRVGGLEIDTWLGIAAMTIEVRFKQIINTIGMVIKVLYNSLKMLFIGLGAMMGESIRAVLGGIVSGIYSTMNSLFAKLAKFKTPFSDTFEKLAKTYDKSHEEGARDMLGLQGADVKKAAQWAVKEADNYIIEQKGALETSNIKLDQELEEFRGMLVLDDVTRKAQEDKDNQIYGPPAPQDKDESNPSAGDMTGEIPTALNEVAGTFSGLGASLLGTENKVEMKRIANNTKETNDLLKSGINVKVTV